METAKKKLSKINTASNLKKELPEGSVVIEKKGKIYIATAVPSEVIKKRRNSAYKYLV